MKIAVVGAGFTGLTAGLRLLQAGHSVVIFEKEKQVGGLAVGFKRPGWQWSLEKHYHHWFSNDFEVFKLVRELGMEERLIMKRPKTAICFEDKTYTTNKTNKIDKRKIFRFDSPQDLLSFPYLSWLEKWRTGLTMAGLKMLPARLAEPLLNHWTAFDFLKKSIGKRSFEILFKPLFEAKFAGYADKISMAWFWARIYKRTQQLAYFEGGYQALAEIMAEKIRELGGEIRLGKEVKGVKRDNRYWILDIRNSRQGFEMETNKTNKTDKIYRRYRVDKVISTLASPIFLKICPQLPQSYKNRLKKIKYLHALNLVLVLKKPFLPDKTYWLNINTPNWPFVVVVEHINFMDKKHYGGEILLYIGNYLASGHAYLKMSGEELLREFKPYLRRINPSDRFLRYLRKLTSASGADGKVFKFIGSYAQPVVDKEFKRLMPKMRSPLPGLLMANLEMTYPFDRGTNYAIELGNKVAKEILRY